MECSIDKPLLRKTIAAVPLGEGPEMRILIHDPLGLTESQMVVTPALFSIISQFTGRMDLAGILTACRSRLGNAVSLDKIREIVNSFDKALLLDSDKFRAHRDKLIADFKAADVRHPRHAGQAYPEDAGEFKKEIGAYFTHPDGPGAIGKPSGRKCRAIIAPHFEFRAGGGVASAHAFKALAEGDPADTALVLGINHGPSANLLPATTKDFATPLGNAETDREFLDALADFYDGDLFEDEFVHKGEHSLEFQAIFLKFVKPDMKIVPILASGYSETLASGTKPSEISSLNSFIEAFHKAEKATGKKVTIVAGVDLSHVGPKFGGKPVTDDTCDEVRTKDQEMLDIIATGDGEAFCENILADNDARNVCGFPGIYLMLRILGGVKGEPLYYSQALEEPTQSMVSFASMAFYE